MAGANKAALRALLMTTCLAPGAALAQELAQAPIQPAAEEATIEEIVVTGEISYRNRTDTVAPELVYDQRFFEQFERFRWAINCPACPAWRSRATSASAMRRNCAAWARASRKCSSIEHEDQIDTRDSRDISFNGDLTVDLTPGHSFRVDAFYLDTRRDETESAQLYVRSDDPGDGGNDNGDVSDEAWTLDEVASQAQEIKQSSYGVSLAAVRRRTQRCAEFRKPGALCALSGRQCRNGFRSRNSIRSGPIR